MNKIVNELKHKNTDKELEQKGLKRNLTSVQTFIAAAAVYIFQILIGAQSSSGLNTLVLILLVMSAVVRYQEVRKASGGLIKSIFLALVWFFGGMFLIFFILETATNPKWDNK